MNELKEECPLLYSAVVDMRVMSGGGRDWIHPTEEWTIPENWKERCFKAEKIASEYAEKTFKDMWPDMPDYTDSGVEPNGNMLSYAIFPEATFWEVFLERFPELKPLDEVLYHLFDDELSDVVYFHRTDNTIPQGG